MIASAENDFKIGPDTTLDGLSVAASDQNYALVWRDLRNGPGQQQMRALVVNNLGADSADVQISAASALPLESPVQLTTIVFDPTTKNFFAVWADNRTGAPGIYGAFITQAGAAVGTDFLIAPLTRAANNAPQVTFTGAGFLIAWQDEAISGSGASRIFFSRVTSTGTPGTIAALPFTTGQDQKLEYLVNGLAGELLLIWQDIGASPNVTRGTRIGGNNQFVAPSEGIFLFQRDFSVSGFGAPIGAAFDGTDYLILSTLGAQIDSSVYRTRLRTDGSVIRASAPFADVGQGVTGLAEDSFPRTFYNGNLEFLFVRNSKVSDIAYHLLTKRVTASGTDRDPNMPLIDSASQGVLNGAMAVAIGNQYFIVWMDARRGGAQPERQLNIFGLFVDATKVGDETFPILSAVGHASPIFGNSPLLVSFGNGGSTGIIDAQSWDFGDGSATVLIGNTTHTYETKGDYVAVFSLIRAGFRYHDFVRISVDTNQLGGGGGPPEVTAGTPGPVSNDVDTSILMYSLSVGLIFNLPDVDSFRLSGYINPNVLPVNVKDLVVSFALAGRTFSVTLGADGIGTSDVTLKPFTRFAMNRFTGAFVMTSTLDKLAANFATLGAKNETVAKPGADIFIPYTFSFGSLTQSSTLLAKYVAKAGKSGRLSYFYGVDGYPGPGYFRMFGGSAKEGGKTSPTHQIAATGNLGLPNGAALVKADSGSWRFSVANVSESIPISALNDNGDSYTFSGGKGKVGLSQFFYIKKSGQFGILFNQIPAGGANPSGMPLASSPFARVDLAVSVDFDLKDGSQFQASSYLRLGRQKAGSKKWKLR